MDYGQADGAMQIVSEELEVDPRYVNELPTEIAGNRSGSDHSSQIQLLEAEIRDLEAELEQKEKYCVEKDEQIKLLLADDSEGDNDEMISKYDECKELY